VTGRASGLKLSAPITPYKMYFPSTVLPSLPSLFLLLLSEKVMAGGMVLNVMHGVKGETG